MKLTPTPRGFTELETVTFLIDSQDKKIAAISVSLNQDHQKLRLRVEQLEKELFILQNEVIKHKQNHNTHRL